MKKLRRWQGECVDKAITHYETNSHFMCLATPGAGKSVMAAEVARLLLESGRIDFIICFSPSNAVADGLRNTFYLWLDDPFDGIWGSKGGSYTYQSLKFLTKRILKLLADFRVLVIFDEIHHCAGDKPGNFNSWGEQIIVSIRDNAKYTLALSGTPWRTDKSPISLAQYSESDNRVICNYMYGLADAINDGVCRVPKIVLIDNDLIEIHQDGNDPESFDGFEELLNNSRVSYQQVLSQDDAIKHILSMACAKLEEVRIENKNAGGLIVASSIQHANKIAHLLLNHFYKSAVVVNHHKINALNMINEFRESNSEWIISVGMISEGTDIPRLQICCHLSRVRTELYFRQVLGRILRVNNDVHKFAWLYTFAEPSIVKFAENLNIEIPEYEILFSDSSLYKDRNEVDGMIVNTGKSKLPLSDNVYGEESQIELNGDGLLTNGFDPELHISDDFRQRVIDLFSSGFKNSHESC